MLSQQQTHSIHTSNLHILSVYFAVDFIQFRFAVTQKLLTFSFGCHSRYDVGNDGFLDLAELKVMMEKLQAPQTHLGLKAMIAEVDEDQDGKISFREFLLIYR